MNASTVFDPAFLARVKAAARREGAEPDAAFSCVFLALAEPERDPATGRPLTPKQRKARNDDLVAWAARRARDDDPRIAAARGTRGDIEIAEGAMLPTGAIAAVWTSECSRREWSRWRRTLHARHPGCSHHQPGWRARQRVIEARRAADGGKGVGA